MRKIDPVDSTMAAEQIAEALDAVTKQSTVERGEVVDSRAAIEKNDEEENVSIDVMIALQSGSLKADCVTNLEEDDSSVIKEHQESAAKLVQMSVKLIDGSLPDKDIITILSSSSIGKFTDGNVIIFYDVKASGEDAKRPEVRKPMLRKAHLERMIKLALHCRTPDDIAIRETDFFVLMDGGRHGNAGTLTGALKDDSDKATPVPSSDHPQHAH